MITCTEFSRAEKSDEVVESRVRHHALELRWSRRRRRGPRRRGIRELDGGGGRAAGGPAWNRQEYISMVSYLDASIENVTAALKNKEMYDNTLIVCEETENSS